MSELKTTSLSHKDNNTGTPNITMYPDGTTSIGLTHTGGFKNHLINGDFRVWQRGTDFVSPVVAQFTADRWRILTTPTRVGRQDDAPEGFAYSVALYPSGSPAGGTRQTLIQPIELPAAGSAGQFFNGSTWTLSFWVKTTSNQSIPILGIFRDVSDNSPNEVLVFTDAVSSTSNWTRVSHTFTIDVNPSASNTCFIVGVDNPTAFNEAIYITGVQLEPGPTASDFEFRFIGTELSLCQRYFQTVSKEVRISVTIGGSGQANTFYQFPVTFRVAPTASDITYTSNTATGGGFNVRTNSMGDFSVRGPADALLTTQLTSDLTLDAEL